MKKLVIVGGVVVVLFAAIVALTMVSNNKKLASTNNPYGDKSLQQPTIDQLDDPNYQNIMLPDELEKKIAAGETVNAYFFSPTCVHCQAFTPELMPIAAEMKVDINQLNVLEYNDLWNEYNITATPTFVHFENGEEVSRFEGALPEQDLRNYFEAKIIK